MYNRNVYLSVQTIEQKNSICALVYLYDIGYLEAMKNHRIETWPQFLPFAKLGTILGLWNRILR